MSSRTLIPLIFLLVIAFSSCEKDKDDPPTAQPAQALDIDRYVLGSHFSHNDYPIDLTFNIDGDLLVTDNQNKIWIFNSDFEPLGKLEDDQGNELFARTLILGDNGDLYLYHHYDLTLKRYNKNGSLLAELNNLQNHYVDGRARPMCLAPNGLIYFIRNDSTIITYNPDLSPAAFEITGVDKLFEHGTYTYQLMGITADDMGNIYLTANVNDTAGEGYDAVIKFDPSLNFDTAIGGNWMFNSPLGLCFDAGYLYVVNRAHSCVKVFDRSLQKIDQTQPNDMGGSSGGKMEQPLNIILASQKFYVTDRENHNLAIFHSMDISP